MTYSNANDIVDELFNTLFSRYQDNLKKRMEGIEFVFDWVQLSYYKCHRINFRRCGSHTDSPGWLKNKEATINPKNEDDKCFQYAVSVALKYEEIKQNPQRLSNIKPFINKYKWKAINYPSKIDDWKTFEKNNLTIALNILYIKEKEICPAYTSKANSVCKKEIIFLIILNEEKEDWHYFAVKKTVCVITWNNI